MNDRTNPDKLPALENGVATACEAGELIERHRATAKFSGILHGRPYVILKDATTGTEIVVYVDAQFEHPTFRKGVVKLRDAPSFISYYLKHKGANSTIYATIEPCKFTAVLDEHPESQAGSASWRDFRAEFEPQLSKEWGIWMAHNGVKNAFETTEEFAYFIEDNAPDFVNPEAAAMMDMALNFKVAQSATYKAVNRLQDGNMDLQYVREVNGTAGGGSVRVPEQFEIEIPLFAGPSAPPFKIEARFRYRLGNNGLKLWYELVRPHKVLETGFKQLLVEVSDGTNTNVLFGVTD